jgi:hypothetical protein
MEVEGQIYAPATLATTPWYLFDMKMIKQKKKNNMDVILKWKTPA